MQLFIRSSDRISTVHARLSSESTSVPYLSEFLAHLNGIWAKVTGYHAEILRTAEDLDQDEYTEDEIAAVDSKYFAVFEVYHTLKGELQARLDQIQSSAAKIPPTDSPPALPLKDNEHSSSKFLVPPCNIPVFAGDYASWPAFRDLFTAVYAKNLRLDPVEKLYHLQEKTKGEAHNIVKRVPLSNEGFNVAWKNLSAAYENKRLLVNIQLDCLFSLPAVHSENSSSLKKLVSGINSVLDSLKLLNISTMDWDPLIVYHGCHRLPDATLALWEQSLEQKTEVPSWSALNNFLNTRCFALDSIASTRHSPSPQVIKPVRSHLTNVTANPTAATTQCLSCSGPAHRLWFCATFKALSPPQRLQFARSHSLCGNCLSQGHTINSCSSQNRCSKCGRKHHSLLHLSSTNSAPSNVAVNLPTPPANDLTRLAHFTSNQLPGPAPKCVLLGTATVLLVHDGVSYPLRALIDPGSEVSFITQSVFSRLRLPCRRSLVQIAGVSGQHTSSSSRVCSVQLSSVHDASVHLTCDAYVLPNITHSLPSSSIDESRLSSLPGLALADKRFHERAPIDMLLGSDLYPQIIRAGVKHNILDALIGQETAFGWVLTGALPSPIVHTYTTTVKIDEPLDRQLRAFWEVEELPSKKHFSPAEQFCENLFRTTTIRNADGRFVVRLPFKDKHPSLGHSRPLALAQFVRNETRLLRTPELHSNYSEVIKEYLTLNHMDMVSGPACPSTNYYLPHHPVIKPDNTTTKLRVVFNASFKSGTGVSLNDILHAGPALQADLAILLMRWRLFKYVFCCDITKMYRQILVDPTQTRFQRILYRQSPSESVQDFELKTVTFGVNCAPFLAIRTLLQLAEDGFSSHPLASKLLRTSLYVDDILAGFHDVETAVQARKELVALLQSAGFSLHKWVANSEALLAGIRTQDVLRDEFLKIEEASSSKMLGVRWNAVRDSFYFQVTETVDNTNFTKRTILSVIAKLFDPVGWLSPLVVVAKILMQRIWLSGSDWDMSPPADIISDWQEFLVALTMVNEIQIPRWTALEKRSLIQIHGFCDASEKAYAGAIYLRCEYASEVTVHLLVAKTRVAPIKTLSLPRLELCGALLLSQMMRLVLTEFNWKTKEIHCWSDSTITLAWLKKPPCTWSCFVANRVSTIQDNVGIECWRHVTSGDNPADLGSRGTTNRDFISSSLWWQGPEWLKGSSAHWPTLPIYTDTDLEKKSVSTHLATTTHLMDDSLLGKFSRYSRALRVFCYILRFAKKLPATPTPSLSSADILFARNVWIKLTQQRVFAEEYAALRAGASLSNKSPLLTLTPALDKSGLMRVHGRLLKSMALSENERTPIILPYNSHFSRLFLQFIHEVTLHGGHQLMLRVLRQEFWMPRAKVMIKSVIGRCKICLRWRKRTAQQMMAALPPARCSFTRPFFDTGVDYAGPFDFKNYTGRACLITKGYVCVFVCFATKAIHLEAVSNLTSDAFLAAFSRFIARRGCPRNIYSDNGTNFVGASRILQREFQAVLRSLNDSLIAQHAHEELAWHFIPPGAPHMGGLWEAGVKSFKTHFHKCVKDFRLTFEEMSTVLCRVEACLNSRPLTVQSENLPDVNVLTPGHFLIGSPLLAPAEVTLDDQPLSYANRWTKLRAFSQLICRRWKDEYLKELHKRYKWKHPTKYLEVNDIVILKSDNLPPSQWRLGKITTVRPGSDDKVRVVELRTADGVFVRPISQLVPLDIES